MQQNQFTTKPLHYSQLEERLIKSDHHRDVAIIERYNIGVYLMTPSFFFGGGGGEGGGVQVKQWRITTKP